MTIYRPQYESSQPIYEIIGEEPTVVFDCIECGGLDEYSASDSIYKARSQARKTGWLISKNRALCPVCNGKVVL